MRLPEKCLKCLKIEGGKCSAFTDPFFQWENDKKCLGYVDDPATMAKMYEEIYNYMIARNYDSPGIKRRAEYYKNLAAQKNNKK